VEPAQTQPLSPFVVPVLSFVVGILGTLLIESFQRPWVERRRRRVERWENDLQQLIELLEVQLPRLAYELNLRLEVGSTWVDEIENRDNVTAQQRAVVEQMLREDREIVERAYQSWREAAQTVEVLTRRVIRFHRPVGVLTPREVSASLYSRLYLVEVSKFHGGDKPSGDYRKQEKEQRERLLAWAEEQSRLGKPARRGRVLLRIPRGRALGLLVLVLFAGFVVILNVVFGP
jgi:hypothetical protein